MDKQLRIVVMGKSGVGKSASANTILGREEFESDVSSSSVTKECKKAKAEGNGRDMYVVDTPGLFDTELSNEEIMKEIAKCISLSSPGPHVFLVVIQLGRFTQEEQDTVKILREIFGEESAKYTMVLFTHGDRLKKKTLEEFISASEDLQGFVDQCHGGYHAFNNNEGLKNRTQVTDLLQKIDNMVKQNGGQFYTSDTYTIVEVAIEKEKKGILEKKRKTEEKEELKQRPKGKKEQKMDQGSLTKELEEDARLQAENNNRFIQYCGQFFKESRKAVSDILWRAALEAVKAAAEASTKAAERVLVETIQQGKCIIQ